jgi:hypothetical protein
MNVNLESKCGLAIHDLCFTQVRIGICDWLAWILLMRRPVTDSAKDNGGFSSSSSGGGAGGIVSDGGAGSNCHNLSRSNSLIGKRRRFSSRDAVTSGNLELGDVTSVSTGVVVGSHIASVFDSTSGDKDWCQRCSRMSGSVSGSGVGSGSDGLKRVLSTTSNSFSRPFSAAADVTSIAPVTTSSQPNHAVRLLKDILSELRQLTDKVTLDDEIQTEINEWRFAAMVVDRLCLCAFTIFTVISTFATLFTAPHVIA